MKKHNQIARFMAICLIFALTAISFPAHAAENGQTVRIGCFPLNGFFNIADDGTVTGYGAAYTDAVASHADWKYEYVPYSSWVDALDALSKNEIDLLAPAQHTTERDALYTFDSFPIGTEYGSLLTLSTNDALIYEDFTALNGLKVGCVGSLVFLDDFKEYEKANAFSVNLTYYKDSPALIAALKAGEVDAIVANMMVKTDEMKLLARFGAAPFYYMLSEHGSYLQEELNQVLDKLCASHPEFQNELSDIYFPDFSNIPFSKEELTYIDQSDTLAVACGANYAPFSYVNKDGQIDGVDRAILEQISQISGLQFSYEAIPSDADITAFLQEKNISLIAGIENDEHIQLHNSDFSEAYLSIPKYFAGLRDVTFDPTVESKVAVVSAADAQISEWEQLYPKFTFVRYNSTNACIDAVHSGEVDLLLDNRYSMENALAAPRNQDLQIFPTQAITNQICFKINALENPEDVELLSSILNKSIRQIPDSDKEMYISDYAQMTRYQYSFSDFLYQYRFQIVLATLGLVIILVALSNVLVARRRARISILENELKLRHITNNINGGVIVLKANTGFEITFANDGFLELIGCTREQFAELHNGSYLAYIHPDDLHQMHEAMTSGKRELSLEMRVMRADGCYIPALFNCTVGVKSTGEQELYCVIMDMSKQHKLLEQLRIENRRTELILDRVEEIFYEINLREHSIITSNSFFEKLGWTLPAALPFKESDEYLKMWHTDLENLDKLQKSTEEMFTKKKPVSTMAQIESKTKHRCVWCEVLQHPIFSEDGTIASIIGLIRDVDNQVTEREQLIEQAQHDQLTGLYNKEAFEMKVTDTLAQMSDLSHALIFIDLDHFKTLNDTLGHMTGDYAICEAADKLKVIFANYDLISRFGGDEFCIFVKNIPLDTLRDKMNWLIDKLHADYTGTNGSVHITCSCGISCTDSVGFSYETLMKCADQALYYSKEHGRDRYTFFHEMPQSDNS